MRALFLKEVNQFFSSVTGYVSIILFGVANGLFILVFPDTNLFQDGYATLDVLFRMAPWILLVLLPAATMRLFAEEWRTGTMESLLTLPLREWEIVLGKYLSGIFLLIFALVPTLVYYFMIHAMAAAPALIDTGAVAGSYLGLFLLGSVFTAIGLWASSVSSQSMVAFLLSVFTCFIVYTGFDALSRIPAVQGGLDYYLQMLGISYHYESVSRGVITLQDLVYFLSMDGIFLYLTKLSLDRRKWD
jgi:ABC-2 type transport system permease protein